jgi:hypothetical protein
VTEACDEEACGGEKKYNGGEEACDEEACSEETVAKKTVGGRRNILNSGGYDSWISSNTGYKKRRGLEYVAPMPFGSNTD